MVFLTKNTLKDYLLILLGSVLYILSFPKFSWSFLIWASFIPFFKALENKPSGQRFRLGFLAGVLSSLGIFYWVTHAMHYYGGLDIITSFSLLLLLVFYLALYFGVFAWLWGWFSSRDPFLYLWGPALWVGLEYLRAHFLTGFPWELTGHSQYNFLPIIQFSEFTGVYGLSFLILLVNHTLYRLLSREPSFSGWKQKWTAAAVSMGLFLLVLGFGWWSLDRQKEKDLRAPSLKVAIVQGNIDQAAKWNPALQEGTVAKYLHLSRETLTQRPELVIWPETALPFYFLNEPRFTPKIFQLAREMGSSLLFGSPAVVYPPNEKPRFYNRAYLLHPEGRFTYYDKVHLVPFGEYVPLKKFLPFVGKMVEAVGDFSAGPGSLTLEHPKGRVGVLICFETIFPELSRNLNKEGLDLLVNMTNDAWYGWTSAPYQHLSLLIFRSVENRIWTARAANTGFSVFIEASGRINQKLPLFQSGTLCSDIPLRGEKTIYTRYGDWLVLVCGIILLIGLIKTFIMRKERK
jgi:apolipoprotein N-acyltransferase